MKGQRFVVAADPHGDQQDPETRKALFSFIKDYNPQIRIHAGDNWDFRNLRRGASDDEKAASLVDDWDMGVDWMREFFDGGKTNHFLRGNHDERMWKFASNASGMLRDYANDGIKRIERVVAQSHATMLPHDSRLGVLRMGRIKVIHGFFAGVGAARKHGMVYGNCLFGHTHAVDLAPMESIDNPIESRGIGCCCKVDMDYNQHSANKLRHDNAWCYGLLFPDGSYQLFQTKKVNGSFYAAENIKQY
jgi:hypothetical protein